MRRMQRLAGCSSSRITASGDGIIKIFKDYLINQVKKAGIEVKLNTTATPAMIKAAGFDTVLVATGAEPVDLQDERRGRQQGV